MRGAGRARAVVEAALISAVFLLAAEVAARLAPTRPRVQVLDERTMPIEVADGVPTWTLHQDVHDALADWTCTGRAHVVLAGDSIFALTDDRGNSVRTDNLAHFLAQRWPDVCFHNVSEPGHGPLQQRRRAAEAVERLGPALLVFQVYKPDPSFRYVAPRWYDLGPYARNATGIPTLSWVSPLLPDAWEASAFDASALYRQLALAFGEGSPPRFDAYRAVLDDSDPRWTAKIFFETPAMDTPFAAQLRRRATSPDGAAIRTLQADVTARGVPYVVHAETLLDTTPEQLRTDPCCHVHAVGHARMAASLSEPLARWLGPPR